MSSDDPPGKWGREVRRGLYFDMAAIAFLAFLCGLFFWRIITPNPADRGFFPSGDFSHQFYAFTLFQTRRLQQGHLPLWSPYHFSGHPFLADVQAATFYPFRLLTILLSAPFGGSLYALELEAVLHFFLASLFMYLFARRLFGNRFAALVSSLVFTYGGYLTSYPPLQLAILEVNIWLPLILLLLDIAWERWKRGEGVLHFGLAGLVLGLSILAGHPQSYMYIFYLSLVYFVFRSHKGEKWLKRAGLFGLFILLGLGLAAVQIVPSLEYMLLSPRAAGNYGQMAAGFHFSDLLHLLLPGALSPWSPLYVGIFPLLLAILAIYLDRRREIILWGAIALIALLLSFGGGTFLYTVFYIFVPGFDLFRRQERAAYLFSFAMAILAGYGALLFLRPMPRAIKKGALKLGKILVPCLIGALALAFLFLFGWLQAGVANPKPFGHLFNRSLFLLLLVLGSLALARLRLLGLKRRGLDFLLLALIILDLFTVNWQINSKKVNPEEEYGPEPILGPVLSDADIFRVANEDILPANYGLVYGVEDMGGASPLRLKRYQNLLDRVPPERVWDLLNVKYVITWRSDLPTPAELVYQEPQGKKTAYLHRLLEPQPRTYLVYEAKIIKSDEEILTSLSGSDFDPQELVILSEDPGLDLSGKGGEGSAVIAERGPERMVVEVETAERGILVLSEIYYPGWHAYVDGKEVKIYRADYLLRALPLEAGHHRVEVIYDPASLKVGMALSTLTLVSFFLFLLARWRRVWGPWKS